MKRPIGVVGLGDLGSRIARQIVGSGYDVRAFDQLPPTDVDSLMYGPAIDPNFANTDGERSLTIARGLGEIIHRCDVIHWAAPAAEVASLPEVTDDKMVIVHDSIMSNSQKAINKRPHPNSFVPAHCLMNLDKRVLVASGYKNSDQATEHLEVISLSPRLIGIDRHDDLMARTQGVFALLIQKGLPEELEAASRDGNLTPSAEELRLAVNNRQANWTKATIQSILSNPGLADFVAELNESLQKCQSNS